MIRLHPNPLTRLPVIQAAGFTLIEIMLAITLLAMITSMVYSSFTMVFANVEAVKDDKKIYEMAYSCLQRISEDLQATHVALAPEYKKPQFNSPPDPYRVVGDDTALGGQSFGRLRFTSLGHIGFEGTRAEGVARIVYYVQDEADSPPVLRRADDLYPFDEFEESNRHPVLCTDVKKLTFTYYDQQGGEYEYWDSESNDAKYATPAVIDVLLEIGNEDTTHRFQTRVALTMHRQPSES